MTATIKRRGFNKGTPASTIRAAAGYEVGTWAPTVTASSGTFTTVSASGNYIKFGELVTFRALITITTVGTASGQIYFTLPFEAAAQWPIYGTNTTSGLMLHGYVGAPSGTQALVVRYDAASAIAVASLTLGGTYESVL